MTLFSLAFSLPWLRVIHSKPDYSWRELDVVKVLKLITARRGVISFSTFTNSNDPFIIDFPPKTSLRKKSDNVSFDWNLFLIEGQVKWGEAISIDHSAPTVNRASLLIEEREKKVIRSNNSNTCRRVADGNLCYWIY